MVAHVELNGVVLATGARVRPPDPAEDRYRLTRTLPPRAVDLAQPRILGHTRSVRYQGALGACASFAAELAAAICRERLGAAAVEELHQGWLYHHARLRRGWAGQDTGSYTADNLDLLRRGAPPRAAAPYVADATWTPPPALEAAARFDYVLSHRPFYPTEGEAVANVWRALDAGMPVVCSSFWPGEWFTPHGGRLPEGVPVPAQSVGHAWTVFGIVPGHFLAQNSWSEAWSADAARFGYGLRAGQFAVPWSYAASGMIWEFRAVAAEPLPLPPDPEPRPEPLTTATIARRLWTRRAAGGWDVAETAATVPLTAETWINHLVTLPDGRRVQQLPFAGWAPPSASASMSACAHAPGRVERCPDCARGGR
jgi:hypothetical protein